MARNPRHTVPVLRLLGLILLGGCLSQAPDAPATGAPGGVPAPEARGYRIVIRKSDYSLTLYREDRVIKTFRAAFGKGYHDGDKHSTGDKRTPEGDFYVCDIHESKRYYKFLGLSYPSLKHAEEGRRSGLITDTEFFTIKHALEERQPPPWNTRLGGAIGIHGRTAAASDGIPSLVAENWTDGCIALDNADVDELYRVVSLGTPVTILP